MLASICIKSYVIILFTHTNRHSVITFYISATTVSLLLLIRIFKLSLIYIKKAAGAIIFLQNKRENADVIYWELKG